MVAIFPGGSIGQRLAFVLEMAWRRRADDRLLYESMKIYFIDANVRPYELTLCKLNYIRKI